MPFARLAEYPFLGWAAVVVVLVGLGFFATFPIGKFRGVDAARRYFVVLLTVGAVTFVAVVVWSIVSGQLAGVVAAFGWGPIIEMGMFGLLYLFAMGFPFVRMIQEAEAVRRRSGA